MKHEIQPELSGQSGQMRIPKDMAISRHIAQFWNPPGYRDALESDDQHRTRQISELADSIGVPHELIKNYTWAQHNLIWELHTHANDEAARIIAHDINLTDTEPIIHRLMVKTAAERAYRRVDHWGHEELNEIELNEARKEIAAGVINWEIIWNQELRGLTHVHREVSVFGEKGSEDYWIIQNRATPATLASK